MSFLNNITVAIYTQNQKEKLIDCISSILEFEEISEIIVIDNCSQDGSIELLKEVDCPYISFEQEKNPGVLFNAFFDNYEVKDNVLFINPDFKLNVDSFEGVEEVFSMEDLGIASFKYEGGYDCQSIRQETKRDYSDVISVSGGIFLIKKSAFNRVGKFNEELLLSDNVLLDYTLRMVKHGIRTRVCEKAVVFYDGDNSEDVNASNADHVILYKIYGMHYFNSINYALCDLIKREPEESFNVLEIGCALGATLIEIKNKYKNSKVFGLEINQAAVNIASMFLDAKVGNIEKLEIPFEEKFDYIIFGDVLEHLKNTEEVVSYCKSILKPGGNLIASIPNLMHITVMEQLLNGMFTYTDTGLLDKTHIHFFTYKEIVRMFIEAGYDIKEILFTSIQTTESQNKLIQGLLSLSNGTNEMMYKAIQYLVTATAKDN